MSEVYLFHDPDARDPRNGGWKKSIATAMAGSTWLIFSGPHAEQRAEQFAEQLRSQSAQARS
jgi:hypothetical protein